MISIYKSWRHRQRKVKSFEHMSTWNSIYWRRGNFTVLSTKCNCSTIFWKGKYMSGEKMCQISKKCSKWLRGTWRSPQGKLLQPRPINTLLTSSKIHTQAPLRKLFRLTVLPDISKPIHHSSQQSLFPSSLESCLETLPMAPSYWHWEHSSASWTDNLIVSSSNWSIPIDICSPWWVSLPLTVASSTMTSCRSV